MMKLLFASFVFALSFVGAAPATAQPALRDIKLVAAQGVEDVFSYPQTATLLSVGLKDDTLYLNTTNTESWPPITMDASTDTYQNATLWMFMKKNGVWYGTGTERLRPGQAKGTKPAQKPSIFVADKFYTPAFGPLHQFNPAVGDIVGFMVVAGSTRLDNQVPLKARSNIVWTVWPADPGLNPLELADSGVEPPPPVVVPPVVVPPQTDLEGVRNRLTVAESDILVLTAKLDAITTQLSEALRLMDVQVDRIDSYLSTRPIPIRCSASVIGIPVSCSLGF